MWGRAAVEDHSYGYETHAKEYISRRSDSAVGVESVRGWAQKLPKGAEILDLGCGNGIPLAEALIDEGFSVYGVDASPSMTEAFRKRFPNTAVACESVQQSRFFDRLFDGIVCWGLMFLLGPADQRLLIRKVPAAIKPGGRFLFTAPEQACTWTDILTGNESRSLGMEAYKAEFQKCGLVLESTYVDEGDNYYYDAVKL